MSKRQSQIDAEQIKQALLSVSFTAQELQEIFALCSARMGNRSSKRVLRQVEKVEAYDPLDIPIEQSLLHSMLKDVLNRSVRCKVPPLSELASGRTKAQARAMQALVKASDMLKSFAGTSLKKPVNRKLYLWFCRQYARICVDYLANTVNAPVSFTSVLNCSDKFPGLFEKAFPGYIDGGMIELLIDGFDGAPNTDT